jgi:hypothetical protein
MSTMDKMDHTIAFNMAGTWVELSALAEKFDVPVEEIEQALDNMDLDWIGDDLSDRAEALLVEELVDVFGETW